MCGIVGFKHKKKLSEDHLREMAETMKYRGPDDEGYELSEINGYQIGLGFKRLAILDLSQNGHQPMKFEHLSLIFNGEVYNYQELGKELRSEGYSFDSSSDTEVILKAYHKWGINAFRRFNGMFSIAIQDDLQDELILVRDRLGIKPLLYACMGSDIIFSSELGPLLKYPYVDKDIDNESLYHYLFSGYVPSGKSMLKGVDKLRPGHYLIHKRGNASIHQYYDIQTNKRSPLGLENGVNTLESLLRKSIEKRLISDVPIGCFLSGGYDSSTVAAVMQDISDRPINTFSLGFKEKSYDESTYASQVANHISSDHHELIVSIDNAKELLENLPKNLDEPLGDSSFIPTWMVSQLASKHIKVVLSGDGGDELFAGYRNYKHALKLYHNRYLTLPFFLLQQIFDFSSLLGKINHRYAKYPYSFRKEDIIKQNELIAANYIGNLILGLKNVRRQEVFSPNELHIVDAYTLHDLKNYLPNDILTKVDRASMLNSIEARTPFLDHELVDFARTVPMNLKLPNGGKYLLKELTHRYIPKAIMERPKKGFSIPVFQWLKNEMAHLVDQNLGDSFIREQQIFNPVQIKQLLHFFYRGSTNGYVESIIWNMIVFQMWWKKNLV